jgi:hypothetical protein
MMGKLGQYLKNRRQANGGGSGGGYDANKHTADALYAKHRADQGLGGGGSTPSTPTTPAPDTPSLPEPEVDAGLGLDNPEGGMVLNQEERLRRRYGPGIQL